MPLSDADAAIRAADARAARGRSAAIRAAQIKAAATDRQTEAIKQLTALIGDLDSRIQALEVATERGATPEGNEDT